MNAKETATRATARVTNEGFGGLLAHYRARADYSQSGLARAVGLSGSMVHLLEVGDRNPTAAQARAFALALGLSENDADRLLIAGGHLPLAYDRVPPSDPDLLALARLLGGDRLPSAEKARLRLLLRLILAQWNPDSFDSRLVPFGGSESSTNSQSLGAPSSSEV